MNTLILFVALAAHAVAPKAELAPVTAASAAVAANPVAPEVNPAPAAVAGRVYVFPQPVLVAECSVTALLRTRFLSGPWSVSRRLEAARRRGDLDEARRMEAALDILTAEAVFQPSVFGLRAPRLNTED